MRYAYHIHKDFGGFSAQEKETAMAMIRDGPKTVGQIRQATGMERYRTQNLVKYLEGIGVVMKVGRAGGSIVWGVRA